MTEVSAWLIETNHLGAPAWWSRVDNEDDGVCGWSSDSLKAIRFARSQDAQAIIDYYGWNTAKPSDHLWLDNEHRWKWFEKFQFTSCEDCGIVQRKDGKNGPCRGRVSVGLRAPSTELTQLVKAAREMEMYYSHGQSDYADKAVNQLRAALVPFKGVE